MDYCRAEFISDWRFINFFHTNQIFEKNKLWNTIDVFCQCCWISNCKQWHNITKAILRFSHVSLLKFHHLWLHNGLKNSKRTRISSLPLYCQESSFLIQFKPLLVLGSYGLMKCALQKCGKMQQNIPVCRYNSLWA